LQITLTSIPDDELDEVHNGDFGESTFDDLLTARSTLSSGLPSSGSSTTSSSYGVGHSPAVTDSSLYSQSSPESGDDTPGVRRPHSSAYQPSNAMDAQSRMAELMSQKKLAEAERNFQLQINAWEQEKQAMQEEMKALQQKAGVLTSGTNMSAPTSASKNHASDDLDLKTRILTAAPCAAVMASEWRTLPTSELSIEEAISLRLFTMEEQCHKRVQHLSGQEEQSRKAAESSRLAADESQQSLLHAQERVRVLESSVNRAEQRCLRAEEARSVAEGALAEVKMQLEKMQHEEVARQAGLEVKQTEAEASRTEESLKHNIALLDKDNSWLRSKVASLQQDAMKWEERYNTTQGRLSAVQSEMDTKQEELRREKYARSECEEKISQLELQVTAAIPGPESASQQSAAMGTLNLVNASLKAAHAAASAESSRWEMSARESERALRAALESDAHHRGQVAELVAEVTLLRRERSSEKARAELHLSESKAREQALQIDLSAAREQANVLHRALHAAHAAAPVPGPMGSSSTPMLPRPLSLGQYASPQHLGYSQAICQTDLTHSDMEAGVVSPQIVARCRALEDSLGRIGQPASALVQALAAAEERAVRAEMENEVLEEDHRKAVKESKQLRDDVTVLLQARGDVEAVRNLVGNLRHRYAVKVTPKGVGGLGDKGRATLVQKLRKGVVVGQ
jgi:hypothetical protein